MENENSVWNSQLIDLWKQSLAEQLALMDATSVQAQALSFIGDVLVINSPETVSGFVEWLVPGYDPFDETVPENAVKKLVETIEQQLDMPGYQPGATVEFTLPLDEGQESVQTAFGKYIAQASGPGSYATAIQQLVLVFSSPPIDTALRRRGINRLLRKNPIEKIVDFQEQIDYFQDRLSARSSHLILVEAESGKGKSLLLCRFMHICQELGHVYGFIDFKEGRYGESQHVINEISRQTGLGHTDGTLDDLVADIQRLCDERPEKKCVLLIDTLNVSPDFDLSSWLIDRLSEPVKDQEVHNLIIVMAGNQYMPRPSTRDGWNESHFTRYLTLPNWGDQEIQQYADFLELEIETEGIEGLLNDTNGDPLTCALIMENRRKNQKLVNLWEIDQNLCL